ncbi:MAG: gamma carbonic anhydrase family protein [Bacteroidota bacterium]|jgi:carbonic anhydrase/acetyltransferase-like protein (isoleucine patch superfamily)|nr:gamma carbonic anhydrase family protein [Bacteroidota bacterium]
MKTMQPGPLVLPVRGVWPQWGRGCRSAPNATLTGDLILGDACTVWYNAVLRGDVNAIRIGDQTNIQDGAVIHCTYQRAATTVGSRVSIGHRAIVHGCTIEDEVLIGMGAVVMDHAVVESGCIVAAGAVILENTRCKAGTLYAGVPARPVKEVSPEQRLAMRETALRYLEYAEWAGLEPLQVGNELLR